MQVEPAVGISEKAKLFIYILNNVAFPILVTLILLRFTFVELKNINENLTLIKLELANKQTKTFYNEQYKIMDGVVCNLPNNNNHTKPGRFYPGTVQNMDHRHSRFSKFGFCNPGIYSTKFIRTKNKN